MYIYICIYIYTYIYKYLNYIKSRYNKNEKLLMFKAFPVNPLDIIF